MCAKSVSVSPSTHALETGEAKLWILLVGVNTYQDEQLPSLHYPLLDCQGLAEALKDATKRFPCKSIMIHHDDSENLPKLENVRASLQKIAAEAKQQDTVLFYLSGHGVLHKPSNQAVLCLADTDTDNNHLLGTGLRLQEVLDILRNSRAHQQLVCLDTCHSGGMTLTGAKRETLKPLPDPTPQMLEVLQQRAQKSKGFYALLSCDKEQVSLEFEQLGHGVFTHYLIQGLQGEAADPQGVISAYGLYQYVYHQTLRYIDHTNQHLRLINQQRLNRGQTQLEPEFEQQTPKLIVEAVGELILGLKPDKGVESRHPRQALIVEGLTGSQDGLNLGKVLKREGDFEVKYWSGSEPANSNSIRTVIQECLRSESASRTDSTASAKTSTVLLYLRGRIENSSEGEACLVLGDGDRLSLNWLGKMLRRSRIAQQIVVLDCPGASSLAECVEDIQGGPEQRQCLLAAAAPEREPEQFATALLKTLNAKEPLVGLTVAEWITKLQVELAETKITLHSWLSGVQGVIEVLPSRIGSLWRETTQGFDLGVCPYMGLTAFKEKDAHYFYGREKLTQKLINALSAQFFLAVVGASGSGKSSLVQAGLIAQLRKGRQLPGSEQWWLGSFSPGSNPLLALSRQLVDSDKQRERDYYQQQILEKLLYERVEGFVYWIRNRPEPMVVLIVDQFEELFTMAEAQERQRFLEIVLGAVKHAPDRFKLVITLRSDFRHLCSEEPELDKAIEQSRVWVPLYLTPEDYRRVIVEPAENLGLVVEPELVEVLLRELNRAGESVAGLAVLEFFLEQLWLHRRKEEGVLTLQAYQQLGGIKGALERKVKEVFNNLSPQEQECAKWIFLKLTRLGEGTVDTRQRILKSQLVVQKYSQPVVEATLRALTSAKLVVMDGGPGESIVGQSRDADAQQPESDQLELERMKQEVTIEVVHEILIRDCPTVRCWIDENRARLPEQREIEQAAQDWNKSGQHSDYLLLRKRLLKARLFYIDYPDELSPDARQFIKACIEENDRQKREEEARRQEERDRLEREEEARRQEERNRLEREEKERNEEEARRQKERNRQKRMAALAIIAILGWMTWSHSRQAEVNLRQAELNSAKAQDNSLALFYAGEGDKQGELNALTKALNVEPNDPNNIYIYINRGIVYSNLGHWQDALNDFNQALQLAPNSVPAYLNRGIVYSKLGHWRDALNDFNTALQLDPNNADAYNNRESVLRELNGTKLRRERRLKRKPAGSSSNL